MQQYSSKPIKISSFLDSRFVKRLGIALFLLTAMPVLAQETASFKVQSIQVIGLRGLSQEAVLYPLKIQAGDWFSESKSADLIKQLYATQWFEDVQLTRYGSRLEIKVVQRPTISQVVFKGNHGLPQEALDKILQDTNLVGGEFLNPAMLDMVKKQLIQAYAEAGKYTAKVSTSLIPEADGIVNVQIEAEAGTALRFASIRLLGIRSFSEARLLAELPISTQRFWGLVDGKAAHCTRAIRHQALEVLSRFYKDNGYYEFAIDTDQLIVTGNRRCADWIVTVREGSRYKVGRYRVIGKTYGLTEEQLKNLIVLKPNHYYSAGDLIKSQQAIQSHFREKGYLLAKVVITPHPDPKLSILNLTIQIEPGEKVYVRRINFLGNRFTKENVLRHLMVQKEASLASSKRQEESEQNLYQSGMLTRADIEVKPILGIKNQVDWEVNVQEKQIQLGFHPIGFSKTNAGFIWTIDLNVDNWFGTGNDVLIKMIKDKSNTTGEFRYKSSYKNIAGLKSVRWQIRSYLTDHRMQWNFKTLQRLRDQSPYINIMQDHNKKISNFFGNDQSDQADKDKKQFKRKEKDEDNVEETFYSSDKWGLELGLDLPQQGNSTWQVTAGFKSHDFYFDTEEEYSDEVTNFVKTRGKVDQIILGLNRSYRNLKTHGLYFPVKGFSSQVALSMALSGTQNTKLVKSTNASNDATARNNRKDEFLKRLAAFKENPLHYAKLDYSGSIFRTLMQESDFGGHTFGLSWDLGVGQQLSSGGLPFFDAYGSKRFYGYKAGVLGPRDSIQAMRGGSLFLKGTGMYYLPKPFQGDLLGVSHNGWPYKSLVFLQAGNVYELDLKKCSSFTKQTFLPIVSFGFTFEVLCKIPMMGPTPLYATIAWPIPILSDGASAYAKQNTQWFNIGAGFLVS